MTKPYYRSTYALVFREGQGPRRRRQSGEQLLSSSIRPSCVQLQIGLYDRSPASAWLDKHKLVEQGVPYQILNADPEQYPGEIIERDLAAGKLDAAIVWGPIAGYFAKRVKTHRAGRWCR